LTEKTGTIVGRNGDREEGSLFRLTEFGLHETSSWRVSEMDSHSALRVLPIIPGCNVLDCDGFVRIEANVWLGDGVVVCPRVTMGEGSVAGANAVVTADVPPFTLVAGVPARPIRRYDPDLKLWVQV
jgi:acetyltransferase-like isoleucine patch superfamily enzyme